MFLVVINTSPVAALSGTRGYDSSKGSLEADLLTAWSPITRRPQRFHEEDRMMHVF